MLGELLTVPAACAVQPFDPDSLGEVLPGHSQLADQKMVDGGVEIVEGGAEAMADHGLRVVQNAMAGQPALEAEIQVFHGAARASASGSFSVPAVYAPLARRRACT
jgi:hypothetical protein